jgi:transposase
MVRRQWKIIARYRRLAEEDCPMKICTIGIDLGKTVFYLIGLDEHGKIVAKKRCSRSQLLAYAANIPTALIGMEACGSHHLGSALAAQGHQV